MDGQSTEPEVMDDTGADAAVEDSESYTFDDALAALADDDDGDQPEEAEAEEPAPEEDDEADNSEAEDEADEGADEEWSFLTPDGEEITAAQWKALQEGSLRQSDYTRKTQEVAQEREALQKERETFTERATFVETALQNLTGFVQSLIPPEPPLSLAQTDPGKYTQQIALRQQAMREMQELFATQQQVEDGKSSFNEAQIQQYREAENAKLAKVTPCSVSALYGFNARA